VRLFVPQARRIYNPGVPVEAQKCPNCGAPLKLDARLACEFCHAPIKVTTPAGRTDREAIIKAIDPAGPFAMQVEDVFVIRGRGTVVTGTIVSGTVRVGDRLEVEGPKGAVTTKCQGVEKFRKSLKVGVAGDNVGLMLDRVERDDVAQGGWVRAAG
jgi:Elongation factor Tu domain 2